jgi:hypothetical protein
MPNNKSHHYVPRCYLKNFSRTGKSIDLFNIASGRLIKAAPIKGQCCRDYFYGKNAENEKSLAAVEGQIAELFRVINREVRLPHPFTAGHVLLCFHVATQAYRTQYAADTLNELTDGMMRQVLKHDRRVTADMLDHVRFGYDDPALISLAHAAMAFPLLMDLECRVLLAPRGTEFMTSDNPVVMFNQYMQWRTDGSNTGIASKGLQVFLPIWPFLTLVMFDGSVYHFGKSRSAVAHIACPLDVHELNLLQVASASENLYLFSSAANVFNVAEAGVRSRRTEKGSVTAFPQRGEGTRNSEIIATSHVDIRAPVQLSFMRIHKHAKHWLENMKAQRYKPAVVVRDETLMKRFDEYARALKTGKAQPEDAIKHIHGKTVADGTF